jgi:hypothetical protein
MPTKGVTEEFAKLMQNVNTLKSTQLYNVTNCNFKLGSTPLTLRTLGKGRFDLKIGKNRSIPYGITAGEAKRSVNTNEKLSKFLGDFMQVLTVASKPVSQRMVLGTLDGVMCGMCCFISKKLMNEEPRLFIDMSFKQQNQILMYGVSDLLKASGPVQQTRSNIGSNITRAMEALNTNIEVSSGSNRSNSSSRQRNTTPVRMNTSNNRREGSGNSNNMNARPGFFGRAARFFGGNKKQNAKSNSTQSPKFKPQTPRVVNNKNIVRNNNNSNTRSFVTASSNNSSNNNNNVTQPVKKRKVNNNVQAKLKERERELARLKERERELARLKKRERVLARLKN